MTGFDTEMTTGASRLHRVHQERQFTDLRFKPPAFSLIR